ncbi:hypothetical protein EPO15_03585 [bacterium]|nr:MAG: hypothetical protein EPO15_03585 [bacterium]
MSAAPADADCNSPPASWGTDWGAYESWCRGCCGTFVRSGTQSRCDPGSNWGCRGSGAAPGGGYAPAVPNTMQGAVLQGIQTGLRQGMQRAAEQRRRAEAEAAASEARRQAAEAEADAERREANSSLERGVKETTAQLEERRKAAAGKAKAEAAARARAAAAAMKGLPQRPAAGRPPAVKPAPALAPKDLSRTGRAKPAPEDAALSCLTAGAYADIEALGPGGAALARDLRAELADTLAELRAKPPNGVKDAVTSVSVGRDQAVAGPGGESQVVVAVLVTRDEATGELRLSALASVRAPGAPEAARQALAVLDRTGRPAASEGPPDVEACLARLAR